MSQSLDAVTLPGSRSRMEHGSEPKLPPPPATTLVPTVNVAKATGWPADAKPIAADGLVVARFAVGLDHPRWLYVLPNGDVLVAETNAPPRPEEGKGIKGRVMRLLMKKAGAGDRERQSHHTSARCRRRWHRGFRARSLLEGLYSPFGMALVGNRLFVADTDALLSFPYARRPDAHRGDRDSRRCASRRTAQPSLDEERHCQP